MIKLEKTSKERGDCTAAYTVILNKKYTVKELIDEILNRDEWGYIGINDGKSFFGNPNIEYRWNALESIFNDEILCQNIESVKADGGWRRMDYLIKLA